MQSIPSANDHAMLVSSASERSLRSCQHDRHLGKRLIGTSYALDDCCSGAVPATEATSAAGHVGQRNIAVHERPGMLSRAAPQNIAPPLWMTAALMIEGGTRPRVGLRLSAPCISQGG